MVENSSVSFKESLKYSANTLLIPLAEKASKDFEIRTKITAIGYLIGSVRF